MLEIVAFEWMNLPRHNSGQVRAPTVHDYPAQVKQRLVPRTDPTLCRPYRIEGSMKL
jgi:hypothetical protein